MKHRLNDNEQRIINYLSDGQWHYGDEIARVLGLKTTLIIRNLSNRTGLLVSSTDHGHKLTKHATAEEVMENLANLSGRIAGIENHIAVLTEAATAP